MKTSFDEQQLQDPLMASAQAILRQCIHCGLCSASCSSYVILGDERASPRGRISLINHLLQANEKPSRETIRFLDNCLSCNACMSACPSDVDYRHLLDLTRSRIGKQARRPLSKKISRKMMSALLPHPGRLKLAMFVGRLSRPLNPLLRTLGLSSLPAMLSSIPKSRRSGSMHFGSGPGRHAHEGKKIGRVALLPGCSGNALRPSVLEASITLLTRAGLEVIVPSGLGCCGAIEHNLGEQQKAIRSAKRHVDILSKLHNDSALDAIIVMGTGCGSQIKDYGHLLRDEAGHSHRAADIAALAKDLSEVMINVRMEAPRQWSGLKVAWHASCGLEHGQKVIDEPRQLLTRAGYIVLEIPEQHICCGASGQAALLQPVVANALRDRKLENINRIEPDIIASGDITCLNHMTPHTNKPIVHIAELLNWAYGGQCPTELRQLEKRVNKVSGVMADTLMEDLPKEKV